MKSIIFIYITIFLPLLCFSQKKEFKTIERIINSSEEEWNKDLKKSLDSIEWAISVSKEKKWIKQEVLLHEKMAKFMLQKVNNFERASYYIEEIRKIALENKNNPLYISIYHNNLGLLYHHEGIDTKRALKEFKKSIVFANDKKITPRYNSLNNYALTLISEGKYDEALTMLRESLVAYESENTNKNFHSLNYLNQGVCYIYKNNPDSVLYYFNKASDFAILSKNIREQFNCNLYIGVYFQEINKIDSALHYLNNSLQLIHHPLNFSSKRLLYESLSECYNSKKDYKKAYHFRIFQLDYTDSIQKQGYAQQAFALDYKFELDSIKYEKNLSELTNKINQKSFENRLTISVSAFILSLLIALFVIFRLNKQRQLNRIKAENEFLEKERIRQESELAILKKEEELIQANVEISIHKNELHSLTHKLESHLEKSYDPEFDDLKHFLKLTKKSEKKLEQLKYINKVLNTSKNAFYQRIKEKFPNLTEDELRLAALIRLNLTSEELILVFNISNASLMSKRYRLRKKMNLKKDQSLEAVIMEI